MALSAAMVVWALALEPNDGSSIWLTIGWNVVALGLVVLWSMSLYRTIKKR